MGVKLNGLEKRLERSLAELLSMHLGIGPEQAEELVPLRGNKLLKGGAAWAVIVRKDPAEYHAAIKAMLPCNGCQENHGTFRTCHMPRVGQMPAERIPPIPADEVPDEFHRDVGEDPIEVMSWEW